MGMLSYALEAGHTYCIDKYEWPNVAGQKPYAFVSWVQANMSCMDAGKRLCTAEEWNNACKGVSRAAYPYGEMYRKGKCVTEARETSPSGKADGCGDPSGVRDMVGNVWEWVVDKRGDYPKMMGGSFRFGKEADCNLSSEGGIGLKSAEVGFRCCK
jgi:formylglycine-generating enzyme required for sulfatase activity